MSNSTENKNKKKLLKIELNSGSESDDSEHELAYYMKDKVKLMKEVLKLIKPKKIKSMAPDCIKRLDVVEINSMLLEELLGISNKRLRYIFNGENVDRETSSSDSDEDKKPIDIISLDDISDDDINITINASEEGHHKRRKRPHKIKKESTNTDKKQKTQNAPEDNLKESEKQKLMSVLELLELQARARAIKSQLALETHKKPIQEIVVKDEDDSDPEAVIIESPVHKEIVLTSSDSEDSIIITEGIEEAENCIELLDASENNVTIQPSSNTTSVIVLDDENEQPKSSNNDDLNLKKQKLFSKAKKIKLKRHKAVTQSSVTVREIVQANVHREMDMPQIETSITVNNVENDSTSAVTATDLSPGAVETNLDTEVDVSQITVPKDEPEQETKSPNKEIANQAYEIDNDEIVVINLDEDEMKGIEND